MADPNPIHLSRLRLAVLFVPSRAPVFPGNASERRTMSAM